ncbi:hypothetical protein [Thiomonas arsenitoxydans]|nr:hypothetical protein [Thiomonas arsenitoxydans]CQR38216.1 conserved hypothetical protein [Thiomonas arsenitoxydans]
MNTADLKSLPAPARNYIKRLETKVSRLEKTLTQALAQMNRQGRIASVKKARVLPESRIRRAKAAPVAGHATPAHTGLAASVAQSEAAKVEWVTSGEVISAKTLADAWGLTPQALGPAAARGEVFAIVVKSHRYYPKEFLELNRDDVGAVCMALGALSPSEKLIFWKRAHGALGGKTVLQSLAGKNTDAQLARVTQLAQAWAAEANAETDVAEAA